MKSSVLKFNFFLNFAFRISISLILSSCAEIPKAVESKSVAQVKKQKASQYLAQSQEDKDRDLVLKKKNEMESSSSFFRAVPQRQKLDLQIANEVVLYDRGLQLVAEKKYGEALLYFNRIIRKFPTSSTVRKALFQKATLYKRMNLEEQSRSLFLILKKKFPDTLEAEQAEIALRALR